MDGISEMAVLAGWVISGVAQCAGAGLMSTASWLALCFFFFTVRTFSTSARRTGSWPSLFCTVGLNFFNPEKLRLLSELRDFAGFNGSIYLDSAFCVPCP
jgi:hypothetical protein